MKSKGITALLLVLMLLLSLAPAALGADELAVSAGSAKGSPGDTVRVPVSITANPGVSGMSLTVSYDVSALTLTSAENKAGGSFSANPEKGIITWLLGRNTSETGEFFSLVFTVKAGAAPGTYPITLALTEGRADNAVNETAAPVPVRFSAGSVQVAGTAGDQGTETTEGNTGEETAPEPEPEETVIEVKAETAEGEAKADLDAKAVSEALEAAEDTGVLTVKVESEQADSVELNLDAEAVKAAAEAETDLHIETEQGTVKLDNAALKEAAESGKDLAVTVTANEDGSSTVAVTLDGESIDTSVKVELPAAESGQVLVRINEDGTEEVVRKSLVEDGKAYAELPAGATVKIVEKERKFEDVKDTDWFAEPVDFTSSHELFQGVSETEFAPDKPMTRAMLVTVLFRLEDEPESAGELDFPDVTEGAWYADAVAWAAETELVTGTEKGFEPNENVSREQIATILYRYVKSLGIDVSAKGDVSRFSDGDEVSDWASDAMAWAVEVGLFQGDGEKLNPGGSAKRSEVAALMQRLVGIIVK